MSSKIGLFLVTLTICLGLGTASAQVKNVSDDDLEMNAAIAKARETLPTFLEKTVYLPKDSWFLKAAVPVEHADVSVEHIWMALCAPDGADRFDCTVNNQPDHADLRQGQPVSFRSSLISDWMYLDQEGKIHGAYTTRVLVSRMPESQVRGLLDQLSPLEEN